MKKLNKAMAAKLFKEILAHRIVVTVTKCWVVPSLKDNGNGYVNLHIRAIGRISIHRLSHLAFNGKIPNGKLVMHKCDNPGCCNPAHVKIGTQLENIRDMDGKGRRRNWYPMGTLNPAAKLNFAKVHKIRKSKKLQSEIAKEFGVSKSLISAIKRNEIWVTAND